MCLPSFFTHEHNHLLSVVPSNWETKTIVMSMNAESFVGLMCSTLSFLRVVGELLRKMFP